MNPSKSNTVLVVIGILLLIAAGYLFYHQSAPATALETNSAQSSQAEQTFISLVGELAPVSFDTAILSDPRFIALTDIRQTVVPEPAGRRDPFSPVSGIATQPAN